MPNTNKPTVRLTDANLEDLNAAPPSSEVDNEAMADPHTVSYSEIEWIQRDNLAALIANHGVERLSTLIQKAPAYISGQTGSYSGRPVSRSLLRALEASLGLPNGSMDIKESVKYQGDDYPRFKSLRVRARDKTAAKGRPAGSVSSPNPEFGKKAHRNLNIGMTHQPIDNALLKTAITQVLMKTANKGWPHEKVANLILLLVDEARDNGGVLRDKTVERLVNFM